MSNRWRVSGHLLRLRQVCIPWEDLAIADSNGNISQDPLSQLMGDVII